jgi:hypothetical protein
VGRAFFWGPNASIPEHRSQYSLYLWRAWSSPEDKFENAITPRIIFHFSAHSSQTSTIISRRIGRSQTLVFYLAWFWFASILKDLFSIFEGLRNIEENLSRIEANHHQGRHRASVWDLTILRIGIIRACERSDETWQITRGLKAFLVLAWSGDHSSHKQPRDWEIYSGTASPTTQKKFSHGNVILKYDVSEALKYWGPRQRNCGRSSSRKT